MAERISLSGEIPQPVVVDRRAPTKTECSKLDVFANINLTLGRIEEKMEDKIQVLHERIDKVIDGMNSMIRLEQQMLAQSKDIDDLEKLIDELRQKKVSLEIRFTELQAKFDSHRASIGQYERVGWMVIAGIGSLAGAYLMKQMGL